MLQRYPTDAGRPALAEHTADHSVSRKDVIGNLFISVYTPLSNGRMHVVVGGCDKCSK